MLEKEFFLKNATAYCEIDNQEAVLFTSGIEQISAKRGPATRFVIEANIKAL